MNSKSKAARLVIALLLVIFLFLAVMIIWVMGEDIVVAVFPARDDLNLDTVFDGLSSLFSGLAFVGIVVALILQVSELTLQRQEIRLTREVQWRQVETLRAGAILDSLNTLIESHGKKASELATANVEESARHRERQGKLLDELEEILERLRAKI